MTIIRHNSYGNPVKMCDFECGREGTLSLFDGHMHACLICAVSACEATPLIKQRFVRLLQPKQLAFEDAKKFDQGMRLLASAAWFGMVGRGEHWRTH